MLVAASPYPASATDPPASPLSGKEREGSQVDPKLGAQNKSTAYGQSSEGVPHISMSSQTRGISATSPDNGIGHDDDIVAVTYPHGTRGPLARQATPVAAGVSSAVHPALAHEVNSLRETLVQT